MVEQSDYELDREEWDRLLEQDPSTLPELSHDFREELWERLQRERREERRRKRLLWASAVLGVVCLALVAYVVIARHFPPR